jgi:hypothetical protein
MFHSVRQLFDSRLRGAFYGLPPRLVNFTIARASTYFPASLLPRRNHQTVFRPVKNQTEVKDMTIQLGHGMCESQSPSKRGRTVTEPQ